jgi:hypothetical protein
MVLVNDRSYGRAEPLVETLYFSYLTISNDLVCQDKTMIQYELLINSYKDDLCK